MKQKSIKSFPLKYPFEGLVGYYQEIDGRRYIYTVDKNSGKRRLISKARYLMSVKLGRVLTSLEEVDHIDGDKSNDDIGNLQILSPSENKAKSVIETGRTAVDIELQCPICNSTFYRSKQRVSFKLKEGKTPTCSRSCGYIQAKKTASVG